MRISFPRVALPSRDTRLELWAAASLFYALLSGILTALHASWGLR